MFRSAVIVYNEGVKGRGEDLGQIQGSLKDCSLSVFAAYISSLLHFMTVY